ncbi:MAG: response regulator [Nannocystales bacterium]
MDDDETTRTAAKDFLEEEGYHVVLAADGAEALDAFGTAEPSVVVTDLEMPRISGDEVVAEIRRRCKETPVIIITGHRTLDARRLAEDVGADGFLNKPIDFMVFLDLLQEHR